MGNYTTNDIQERVDRYISQFKEGYFSPLALQARLTEEVGEMARRLTTGTEKSRKRDGSG